MGSSGAIKSATNTQNSITNQALGISSQANQTAQNAFGQRADLLSDPIAFYKAMASGDQGAMMNAAAPAIGNIATQTKSAIGSMRDQIAPGAARDFSIANAYRGMGAQNASFMNNAYMSAFPALTDMGNQAGNFGLQNLGASLNGLGAGSSSNQVALNSAVQQHNAFMNMLGGLGGLAGTVLGAGTGGGGSLIGGLLGMNK